MARARNIKPSFFTNEDLVELAFEVRLLFIGLWTLADREGRLEDRPKRIKMAIFPADNVDVESGLEELAKAGFIDRYTASGVACIQVVNFAKHQNPHVREAASELPENIKHDAATSHGYSEHCASTVPAPGEHCASHADSLNPYSLNPLSLNPESGERARASQPEPPPTPEPAESARSINADSGVTPATPTAAGEVCLRMRKAGITGVNPSHARLHALLEAGLQPEEIASIAEEPGSRGKGMAWVLAAAEGRRRDAANVRPLPRASPAAVRHEALAASNLAACDEAKRMLFQGVTT